MFRSSCQKLIFTFFLLILMLSGCTTAGKGRENAVSPGELIPGGCSTYISGKLDVLPGSFRKLLKDYGVPSGILRKTDRVYVATGDGGKYTVLFTGDFKGAGVRSVLGMKERFIRSEEVEYLYYDSESESHIYVPDRHTVLFSQEKPEAFIGSSFQETERKLEEAGIFTEDIFIYGETEDFSVITSAAVTDGNFVFNSVFDFGSRKKAKIFSTVIRLYVVDLINRNSLDADTGCVSVEGSLIRISNFPVPKDKLDSIFNFYKSEFTGK